ncbi:hypothetical protein HN358_05285 [Candidatus Uhrbacteria bacterium]|jgi:plastocyanin|nr:hypothetical protein [Candidatus Uhrbacteria bacterium]MBT7716825.1 hypothetical protein [Candidatus Uhrbacteria bacterium]
MNTSTIKRSAIALVAILMAFGAFFGIQQAQALTSYDDIEAGDLVRGETFTAVYYIGADGLRYVFPNDKTYFTWYSDFESVEWISDSDLAKIQIGANVTYKPGVKMVKVTSDHRTYAIAAGGTLRHVTTEEVAIDMYGSSWNTMIDDVPDGFFSNYTVGDAIAEIGDYDADEEEASALNIGDDKGLLAPAEIVIDSDGFDPICAGIEVGQGVRFINNDSDNHSVTADNLTWGSGTMAAAVEYIETFDEDGTFSFYDGYDSANSGAIYVGDDADDCTE